MHNKIHYFLPGNSPPSRKVTFHLGHFGSLKDLEANSSCLVSTMLGLVDIGDSLFHVMALDLPKP